MKKTKLVIISIIACSMFISCSVSKQATVPPAEAPKETLGQKYDKRFSLVLDSLVLSIQKIEDGVSADTASVDQLIRRQLVPYGDSIRNILTQYIPDWEKYVKDSSANATASFVTIKVTGAYVTVPRVLEIIKTLVTRNGKSKNLNMVLVESIELRKKGFYFLRGDNMKYHYLSPMFAEASYYDANLSTITDATMSTSIGNFFIGRPVFADAKPTDKLAGGRLVYNSTVAKNYWIEGCVYDITNYIYAAIIDNIAWRHSKQ